MPYRCFVAIAMPEPARRLLRDAGRAFVAAAPEWAGEKWVAPDLMHVTVRFLGDVPDPRLAEALELLSATAATIPPFRLALDGVRAVPGMRRATMLWGTLTGDVDACGGLASLIGDSVADVLALEPERRPFTPHVTLVRTRRPRGCPSEAIESARAAVDVGKDAVGFLSVPSVRVLSSTLTSNGPVYTELAEVSLGH